MKRDEAPLLVFLLLHLPQLLDLHMLFSPFFFHVGVAPR